MFEVHPEVIDIVDQNEDWCEWSTDAVLLSLARGPVMVNQIVLAEVAAGFDSPSSPCGRTAYRAFMRNTRTESRRFFFWSSCPWPVDPYRSR